MKILEELKLYELISNSMEMITSRRRAIAFRKEALNSLLSNNIVKVAFDTRRIDQETEINPRRGLQNYNRSEKFISEATQQNINTFNKLKNILQSLKDVYGKEPEWQDSYARVLLASVEKSLRVGQKDGDFTDFQPGVGNFDYLNQLLYVRYRLTADVMSTMTDEQIKKAILDKDDGLIRTGIDNITRHDVAINSYDILLDKLFNIKATSENPSVERSITITIRDTFLNKNGN